MQIILGRFHSIHAVFTDELNGSQKREIVDRPDSDSSVERGRNNRQRLSWMRDDRSYSVCMASKRGDKIRSVDGIDADRIAGYCANVIADEARYRLKIGLTPAGQATNNLVI
jgi:hypothetical protein